LLVAIKKGESRWEEEVVGDKVDLSNDDGASRSSSSSEDEEEPMEIKTKTSRKKRLSVVQMLDDDLVDDDFLSGI
jgi:hypothetical protein